MVVQRRPMPTASLGWTYDGPAADRLWHKSAIGRRAAEGSLMLSAAEILFCHHHRNLDFPSQDWMDSSISSDGELLHEYAVLEALRVPGNKVVLSVNLQSVEHSADERSWAARWPSDSHPRDSAAVAEIRWFMATDPLDVDDLLKWAQSVSAAGRIAEALVVDDEFSVVTYRLTDASPQGSIEADGLQDSLNSLSGGIAMNGGRLYGAEDWNIQQVGIPTDGGVFVDDLTCELIDSPSGLSVGGEILADLLSRGLHPRPGFKYGTRWRCYDKPLGEDHAPFLIVLPEQAPTDWAGACLASRLAAGVNKTWLLPTNDEGSWCYLAVTRPPADSRWSNPQRR